LGSRPSLDDRLPFWLWRRFALYGDHTHGRYRAQEPISDVIGARITKALAPELNQRVNTLKTTLRNACGQELVKLLAFVRFHRVDGSLAVVVKHRSLAHQCPALDQATNLVIGIDMS